MSIWTDMIKYNKKNKLFAVTYNNEGQSYLKKIDLDINQPSLSFVKFATFIPELDGNIKNISITLKALSFAGGNTETTIEIRDKNNNVIKNVSVSSETVSGNINIQNLSVKAFQKYDFYFKTSTDSAYATVYVPNVIVFNYSVMQTSKYLKLTT